MVDMLLLFAGESGLWGTIRSSQDKSRNWTQCLSFPQSNRDVKVEEWEGVEETDREGEGEEE